MNFTRIIVTWWHFLWFRQHLTMSQLTYTQNTFVTTFDNSLLTTCNSDSKMSPLSVSDRAASQTEHGSTVYATETAETYHRMCGGLISLRGVGVGPSKHVTCKLYDCTLQTETDTWTHWRQPWRQQIINYMSAHDMPLNVMEFITDPDRYLDRLTTTMTSADY